MRKDALEHSDGGHQRKPLEFFVDSLGRLESLAGAQRR